MPCREREENTTLGMFWDETGGRDGFMLKAQPILADKDG